MYESRINIQFNSTASCRSTQKTGAPRSDPFVFICTTAPHPDNAKGINGILAFLQDFMGSPLQVF